jgi:hypothetical protein
MRKSVLPFLICVAFLLLAREASAQSAVAGVVTDASGAVLPGVTVEASSPALIEKTKSTVTDVSGQYRIVDLRPGTYTVTFSLSGFGTIVRQDIRIGADFTAPINVEMRIGAIEESVTVTGESPVVDVQSSQVRQVVSQDLLEAIPTGRTYQQFANITPAVSTGNVFDVGGSSSVWTGGSLVVHGSIAGDSRTLIDGMVVDAMFSNGQCSCVYDNENQTQEVVVQVSGGLAEHQLSGVLVNRIPKSGGNTFTADSQLLFSNGSLQGNNVDDELRARGMTTPAQLAEQYDINYSASGPIFHDRLWFFASGRHWTYNNYVADVFNPDGTQAVNDNELWAYPFRLTWQMSSKDRLTGLITVAQKKAGHYLLTSAQSPEAVTRQDQPGEKIAQLKWTSTPSPSLLLEVGASRTMHNTRFQLQPEVVIGTCHVAYNLCAPATGYGDIPHFDQLLNKATVAPRVTSTAGAGLNERPALSQVVNVSLAYVSGAHSFKVGFQNRYGWLEDNRPSGNADLNQIYRNGVPFAVEILNTPVLNRGELNRDLGVYVQDTWTRRKLTLSGGLRWDSFNSSLPAQTAPAGRFVPERSFPEAKDLPNWNNVVPRIGVSYDLTGEGKTAVKANYGVYVASQGTGYATTYSAAIFSVDQRNWTDLNRDDVAQENEIGPTSNRNFGVRRNQIADPDTSRPYQSLWDVALQQQLFTGTSLSVGYYNRRLLNNIWTRSLVVDPVTDYTLVQIADPRGTGTLPVYNLAPDKLGQVADYDSNSSNNETWFRGVDVTINGRWRGFTFLGGTSTGRTVSRVCDVADPNNWRFCDQSESDVPFQTQFKLAGSATLPYGIRFSGNFQSRPGTERIIIYPVVRSILPTLTQSQVNVRLNDPGSEFNDRVNQLDITLSKVIRLDRLRVRPELAIFNALNANAVLGQTNTYGPTLNNVQTILSARMLRLGVNLDF